MTSILTLFRGYVLSFYFLLLGKLNWKIDLLSILLGYTWDKDFHIFCYALHVEIKLYVSSSHSLDHEDTAHSWETILSKMTMSLYSSLHTERIQICSAILSQLNFVFQKSASLLQHMSKDTLYRYMEYDILIRSKVFAQQSTRITSELCHKI